MPYTLLSKLFYENKSEYEEKYRARYESEYTVHLHFDVNGNSAFFVQTPAIYHMLADILRMNKEVSDLCDALPPAATEQFFRRCLTDEIVLTNNIEGVISTRKEILEILDELEEKSKGKRDLEATVAQTQAQLDSLQARTDEEHIQATLRNAIADALQTLTSPDATLEQKNNAARTVLDTCVFDKATSTLTITYRSIF